MRMVIDVGALDWGPDASSIEKLADRFEPALLMAFDPYHEFSTRTWVRGETTVVQERKAAWTRNGKVSFWEDGTASRIPTGCGGLEQLQVECFDLGELIERSSLAYDDIILKLDCDGAEHAILPHLARTGALGMLSLLLVEFHGAYVGKPITVPWEVWS